MPHSDKFGVALQKQKSKQRKRNAIELCNVGKFNHFSHEPEIGENSKILESKVIENSQIKELIHKKEIFHEKMARSKEEQDAILENENIPISVSSDCIFIRPDYRAFSDKDSFKLAEKESFYAFKRQLYDKSILKKQPLTPFEKNLDIWLQMWRVIEKSDIIIQVVDSRNPEFFYCHELTQHIEKEHPKKRNLLVINKSDLIQDNQHEILKEYYKSRNIETTFFSSSKENKNDFCLTSETFISKLHEYTKILSTNKISVGFIGFPNVGKSSLLNSLIGEKRVAISSTPGKTKHLQSHVLSENITLYDSPGLVFPKFVQDNDYLTLNGIIPIDQALNISSSIKFLVKMIPTKHFEKCYIFHIPAKNQEYCTSEELLISLATFKGYLSHKNVPDMSKAAKLILKDLFSGKLLLCYPPTDDISLFVYNGFDQPYEKIKSNLHLDNKIKSFLEKSNEEIMKEIDEQFKTTILQKRSQDDEGYEISLHKLRKGPKNPRRVKLRRLYPDK